ncbi:hypothetical protein B0H14DRAFT_3126208 [Mycena olivaceomarginata]|nr:hypothetical protein B0H14DRAFT_3126208 [Mycena olivaceomarginata]
MSITTFTIPGQQKEMKKMEAQFSRRLNKVYQELDSMKKDVMAFFLRPEILAPKTKKQIEKKAFKSLGDRGFKFETIKAFGNKGFKGFNPFGKEGILKHALEIPPTFDASDIKKLLKKLLKEGPSNILEELKGPMDERTNKDRAAAIISILEGEANEKEMEMLKVKAMEKEKTRNKVKKAQTRKGESDGEVDEQGEEGASGEGEGDGEGEVERRKVTNAQVGKVKVMGRRRGSDEKEKTRNKVKKAQAGKVKAMEKEKNKVKRARAGKVKAMEKEKSRNKVGKRVVSWPIRNAINELADAEDDAEDDAEEDEEAGVAEGPKLSLQQRRPSGDLSMICRHIWLSPSAALHPEDNSWTLQCSLPRLINDGPGHDWLCVRAPCRSDWDTLDGLFNYEEFFEAVVALFTNDPQDPWTVGRGIKNLSTSAALREDVAVRNNGYADPADPSVNPFPLNFFSKWIIL